jgi:hypothetical protein
MRAVMIGEPQPVVGRIDLAAAAEIVRSDRCAGFRERLSRGWARDVLLGEVWLE